MNTRDRVTLVINDTHVFSPFIAITFGFTVADQSIDEDTGTVTLQVSVISGTLQRSVNITYHTVELALGNVAKSKTVHVTCLSFSLL